MSDAPGDIIVSVSTRSRWFCFWTCVFLSLHLSLLWQPTTAACAVLSPVAAPEVENSAADLKRSKPRSAEVLRLPVKALQRRLSLLLRRNIISTLETTLFTAMDTRTCEMIIAGLRDQNAKAVVFDFDCTISLTHSGGRVRKERFPQFLEGNISPCFKTILPMLINEGFQVGVATFADGFRAPATHVAGEEMIRQFFQHHFKDDFRDRIPIVAAYPENYQAEEGYKQIGLTSPMPMNKEYHLVKLAHTWGLKPSEMVLVDDDLQNVEAARQAGHHVRFVRIRQGVTKEDMLDPSRKK